MAIILDLLFTFCMINKLYIVEANAVLISLPSQQTIDNFS